MKNYHEYLILGAGPAGVQFGYFLEKAGYDYLVLEGRDKPGAFFENYPRRRMLISINKVYTGYDDQTLNFRYDWNSLITDDYGLLFKDYSKKFFPNPDDLLRYLADFVDKYQIDIRFKTPIVNVRKEDGIFHLTTEGGEHYSCKYLIVASGVGALRRPDIPGLDLVETYEDMSLDYDDYNNQRVLIIGKGNSAFEVAEGLTEHAASIHLTSPNPLKLAWESHHVGHLRAVNTNFLDTYLLKIQNGMLEAHIQKIERLSNGKLRAHLSFTRAHGQTGHQDYDRIILCAGFQFDCTTYEESARPDLAVADRFPNMTSNWESTNIPNMFFAGTLMQMRDFKKTQSSFIHGFRYNVRTLFHMLNERNHGVALPSSEIGSDSKTVGDHILDRLNRAPSLWHQPGFLTDVIQIDQETGKARYINDIPADYIMDEPAFADNKDYITVSLEYGPDHPDFPFEFDRYHEPDQAHLNPQLHPIIRRYKGRQKVAEHHVMEELEGRWVDPEFTEPLFAFLSEQLDATSVGA